MLYGERVQNSAIEKLMDFDIPLLPHSSTNLENGPAERPKKFGTQPIPGVPLKRTLVAAAFH